MDTELSSQVSSITSPVLLALRAEMRPNPLPACASCPGAVWFVSEPALACFCRVMHLQTWDSLAPQPLLACDGQVIAAEQERRREVTGQVD